MWVTVGPPDTYQSIPLGVVPSYPSWNSHVPDEYAPSGYEPLASTLTYGPAKAAPENRRGVAAQAASVDLIICILLSRR